MWKPFIFENLHFALNAFGALSLFSIFWLYFDVWLPKKNLKDGLKVAGFLLLSLSFLLHATQLEATPLESSVLSSGLNAVLVTFLRTLGYILVATGLLAEDRELPPREAKEAKSLWFLPIASLAQPVLAAGVGWLYLKKVAIGLEHHLKRVSLGFFALAIYELLALRGLFVGTSNIDIYEIVAPFGILWIIEHIIAALAFVIFFGWAFSYLLKRINTQLFIILTSMILAIFLLTAVSFTFLLLKNMQDETLSGLETDASVLSFALDAKASEAKSIALTLSQNALVSSAIAEEDKTVLAELAEETLLENKVSSVIILDGDGKVVGRGEDRERTGDSLSDDSLAKRSLLGEERTSIITKDGAFAPEVLLRAAVPVKDEKGVVGVALVGISIDNAFMDGVKKVTGLEAAIFGGDTLSAATITDLSGKGRPIGIKETNKEVLDEVLAKGGKRTLLTTLLNRQYFASYQPLKDIDATTVGMVLIGKPAYSVLIAAGRSIELTFLISALLIVISIVPTYLISRYIAQQFK